ncbi:hypothetical protein J6590_107084, partial [Homalodisca vitripennis]
GLFSARIVAKRAGHARPSASPVLSEPTSPPSQRRRHWHSAGLALRSPVFSHRPPAPRATLLGMALEEFTGSLMAPWVSSSMPSGGHLFGHRYCGSTRAAEHLLSISGSLCAFVSSL